MVGDGRAMGFAAMQDTIAAPRSGGDEV